MENLSAQEKIQLEWNVAAIENENRVTLAQIIGGCALLAGLYFTYQNLRITEEGKLTDRFSKAVELIGNANLDVRIGGIYALERLAIDSKKDYRTILEILTAFIREKSRWNSATMEDSVNPPKADVQAAMTVVGKIHKRGSDSEPRLDLIGVDFRRADLVQINFRGADLADAHFEGADLRRADFQWANLKDAHFEWTNWNGEGADLREANLKQANLTKADLRKADLRDAVLISTDLTDADLTDAKNLHWNQVKFARNYEKAKLPASLEKEK